MFFFGLWVNCQKLVNTQMLAISLSGHKFFWLVLCSLYKFIILKWCKTVNLSAYIFSFTVSYRFISFFMACIVSSFMSLNKSIILSRSTWYGPFIEFRRTLQEMPTTMKIWQFNSQVIRVLSFILITIFFKPSKM